DFTGISSPYEEPESPQLKINTGDQSLEACVDTVLKALLDRKVIPAMHPPVS
ncbi:MAG: adenylyl-sulfate kinase, partial [Prochlorococcus sp.]